MKIIKKGSLTPEQRKELTCPKCGTVFIYRDGDVHTEMGKAGAEEDHFRYTVTHYPDAFYFAWCPLKHCNSQVFLKSRPDYTVEDWGW